MHMGRFGLLLLALALATEATAERNYVVGTTTDFAGGFGTRSFYSVYPSIDLQSAGNHSVFGLNYTFGLNREYEDVESHSASLKYSHAYNRLRLNLSETFEKTPDITSANVLRGVAFDPQAGFRYVFDPVAIRRSTRI